MKVKELTEEEIKNILVNGDDYNTVGLFAELLKKIVKLSTEKNYQDILELDSDD